VWDCGGSDALSLHKHTDHKVQLSDVENCQILFMALMHDSRNLS
jgi:hypothetical protein